MVVTQNVSVPSVSAGPDKQLTCSVTSVLLDATVGGGTPSYTYSWKNSANVTVGTTEDITVSSPDTYTLTVTDANGCSASDAVVVTQNVSVPSVNAGPDQEVCEDGLPVTLSGATPSGGNWTGTGVSGNTFDPSGLAPGDYPVTYSYTDTGTGCSSSEAKTVTVNPRPTADAGPDRVILPGDSVVIGGTPTANATFPYTVSWTPATGLDNASFDNPSASPTVNTTYTVTVTDSRGCIDTDDMVVTVDETCCICGFVYRAGTMEPLAGWDVILEKQINPWVQWRTAITDANGKYCFCGLGSGEYRVSEVVQPGWTQVSPLPNEHLVTLPGDCCDPISGPFLNFQNQQGGNSTVGWEVSPVDRPTVVAPWIALFAAIIAGTSFLVLRRRRG